MTSVPVVSFIGRPDSGKTTLLEKIIPELVRRGFRVGLIKHHVHHFEMDTPGKDTWRLKKAGCSAVLLSSPSGLGFIRDTERDAPVKDLVDSYFSDMDLVLTEGYKQEPFPKIEVFRTACSATPLAPQSFRGRLHARVTDTAGRKWQNGDTVCFSLDETEALVDYLVATFLTGQNGD